MAMRYPFLDLKATDSNRLDELKKAACRVIESGRYIGGPEIESFETNLAAMLDAPYAIGVSNGLDALRLILRAYIILGDMQPGDEVIVPANTYIATILAVTDARLVPVLVEPSETTLNLDTSLLESALTPKTRAVMPVHLYGNVCWDTALVNFSRRHSLKVIEDAAQSIGARAIIPGLHGSNHAGALGDAAGISFYPTKNIGALGDAGAVVTHDRRLAETVRALANYGSDRRYHNIIPGFNCRLDPIQAALLNVKLPDVNINNADRFARALAYNREITHPSVIKPQVSRHIIDQVWHQYVIRVTGGNRDKMQRRLSELGVGTDIHYAVPPHLQPCYRDTLTHRPLPLTERLAGELLSLPIGPGTSVKDAADIARIINSISL